MFCKKRKVFGLAGLLVLCCIGGVFAYWTQEELIHNEFKVAKYDTKIEEEFKSPDDWLPGTETNKDVWIKNDSSIPIIVKVTIHQSWVRRENVLDVDGTIIPPEKGEYFSLTFQADGQKEYAAEINWGSDVMLLASGKTNQVSLDLPVADTVEDAKGRWLLVSDEPDSEGNLLLYYIGTIAENSASPKLVDAVTMNPKIRPSVLVKKTIYNKETAQWETSSVLNETGGYDCARYMMTISASTVQATKDAVIEVFNTAADKEEIVDYLAELADNLPKF